MSSLRHFLVPLDFEAASSEALSRAVELARSFDASITLLHVVDVQHRADSPHPRSATAPSNSFEDAARRLFIRAAAKLCAEYPRAHAVMRRGMPSAEILSALKDTRADLVVMGACGRGCVVEALRGRVAEAVVRLAHVPVLTVGAAACSAEGAFEGGPGLVRKILVPTALGETSDPALDWATAFASTLGARVIVTPMGEDVLPVDASDPRRGDEVCNAARQVVGLAKSSNADMIVIGSHDRPSETRLESVAERVVRTSPIPVLTIRDPRVWAGRCVSEYPAA
jgi:nucleotide-binding universal stress UspA family protein